MLLCSLCAAQRSAQGSGAFSKTEHQTQGPGGQTPGEQRWTRLESTQREGKCHTLWLTTTASAAQSLYSSCCPQVTEEVLSILRLLSPLTDKSNSSQSFRADDCLDITLAQLQSVARQLAISHTEQVQVTGKVH